MHPPHQRSLHSLGVADRPTDLVLFISVWPYLSFSCTGTNATSRSGIIVTVRHIADRLPAVRKMRVRRRNSPSRASDSCSRSRSPISKGFSVQLLNPPETTPDQRCRGASDRGQMPRCASCVTFCAPRVHAAGPHWTGLVHTSGCDESAVVEVRQDR